MSVVISVENLSKSYRLGQIGTGTLTNDLKVWWAKAHGKSNPLLKIDQQDHGNRDGEEIWALRDVTFQVQQGEALGIIGRNGAGKSTLLKVLSRVTAPTFGQIKVKGRIASLLEVGTGFHPDLTGRENIFLNGAILGMKKEEVKRKFGEIVAFAEVEKFIDTPVKRYSSGMYVRLAFAVAAYLDPEILIVDEVLAVGDAAFQSKCIGKISDVADSGRTVLFVSHNMPSVNRLCNEAILIENGRLVYRDKASAVVNRYVNKAYQGKENELIDCEHLERSGIGGGKIRSIELENRIGQKTNGFGIGESIIVKIHITLDKNFTNFVVGLELKTTDGLQIVNLRSDSQGIVFKPTLPNKEITFMIKIPGLSLYPGSYLIQPWFAEHHGRRIDHIIDGIRIDLSAKGNFQAEQMLQQGRGLLIMDCEWFQL